MAGGKTLTPAQVLAALQKAQRQKNNENTASRFAIAIAGIIGVFTIINWIDLFLYRKQSSTSGPVLRNVVSILRSLRGVLLRKVPGFPTLGHAIVFVVYISINITLSFTNLSWATLNNWAKRLGWVAVCNLALLTFLALKNTPLAFLTSYSYERLNILHRVAGYTAIFWSVLHAVVYIIAWSKSDSLHELLFPDQIVAEVAGFAMLTILASAFLLRKMRYEIFYVIHIVMFMLILITVGMHRPEIAKKTLIIVIFSASIWVLDRLVRSSKLAWYALGNNATITALPHGAIHIILKRSPWRATPGSHVFLWIPAIRLAETHPFTIASTNPVELVVKAHDGFTKDLLSYANANPGAVLRASVDGPYGTLPNFAAFDHVVLIAGGSGASFTFGVAVELLKKLEAKTSRTSKPKFHFVWVVREIDYLTHFSRDLAILAASPLVTLHLNASRFHSSPKVSQSVDEEKGAIPSASTSSQQVSAAASLDQEKNVSSLSRDVEKSPVSNSSSSSVVGVSLTSLPSNLAIHNGRPNVATMITDFYDEAKDGQRVIVSVCGPQGLVDVSRKSVEALLLHQDGAGPGLEFYAETFGW